MTDDQTMCQERGYHAWMLSSISNLDPDGRTRAVMKCIRPDCDATHLVTLPGPFDD